VPAHGLSIGLSERRRRGPAFLRRLLALGTEQYPPKVRRRLQTLNAMAYLIVITSTIYALIYALEDLETYYWIVLPLQLQQPAFEVSLLCGGLMSAPPSRPSNDEGWLNAPLRQSDRYAPDFLHRPGNRQAWR